MLKRHVVRLTDEQRRRFKALARGGQAAHNLAHVRFLLNADANDPTCWTDQRINESLDIGVSTGTRVRRLYCEKGLEVTLLACKRRRTRGCGLKRRDSWAPRLLAEKMDTEANS